MMGCGGDGGMGGWGGGGGAAICPKCWQPVSFYMETLSGSFLSADVFQVPN